MMRFLRGTFFRIGGIAYNDFEDFPVPGPAEPNLGLRATLTAGMSFGASSIFHRDYVLPPPRDLNLPADDFTRPPIGNGPLGLNWDVPVLSGTTRFPFPQVINNQVREGTEHANCCAYWKGNPVVPWENDPIRPELIAGQFAQIVIQDPLPHGTLSGGSTLYFVAVLLRCDTAAGTAGTAHFYMGGVFWDGAKLDTRLYYWDGSTFQPIGVPNTIIPWVIGDVLRCEIIGDETPGNPCIITVLHNATPVFRTHVFGAAFKAGGGPNNPGPGIAIHGTDGSFWLDNWTAGELRPPPDHLFHRENWNSQADGPLGNPWAFSFAGQPRVNNHQVVTAATTSQGAVAYYGQTGFNASNQYAQVRIVNFPTAEPQGVGVVLRTGDGVSTFYAALIHSINNYKIWYYDPLDPIAHGYIQKQAGTVPLVAAGRILRAEITGNSPVVLNMYYDGVLILQHTFTDENTEIRVGGFPGLAIFDPAGMVLKLDDWEGGKL